MTGREVLFRAAVTAGINSEGAERLLEAIAAVGFVCVPKEPTTLMIKNAWAGALAEDAAGVWLCMIEASEDPDGTQRELDR